MVFRTGRLIFRMFVKRRFTTHYRIFFWGGSFRVPAFFIAVASRAEAVPGLPLVVFTNFEGESSLRYQLPYLQRLAKQHLVGVIFFRNTELEALAARRAESSSEIFISTVSAQLLLEKRQMVRELQINGIQGVLTEPENATLNTLNQYLELKLRGLI